MDPYLGEIRIVSQSFAPKGWALCNGQLLNINSNQALWSILGKTYGGDGITTFAIPDLRGKLGIGMSKDFILGNKGGNAMNTLTVENLPAHTHQMNVSNQLGNNITPNDGFFANAGVGDDEYTSTAPTVTLSDQAIATAGASAPVPNMQPYLSLNFIIALVGIYPSKNY